LPFIKKLLCRQPVSKCPEHTDMSRIVRDEGGHAVGAARLYRQGATSRIAGRARLSPGRGLANRFQVQAKSAQAAGSLLTRGLRRLGGRLGDTANDALQRLVADVNASLTRGFFKPLTASTKFLTGSSSYSSPHIGRALSPRARPSQLSVRTTRTRSLRYAKSRKRLSHRVTCARGSFSPSNSRSRSMSRRQLQHQRCREIFAPHLAATIRQSMRPWTR